MHFHIITLFPESVERYLKSSILGRALAKGSFAVSFYHLRDFNPDPKRRVDDRPFSGGPGMVLRAEPVLAAVDHIRKRLSRQRKKKPAIILLAARGKQFTNTYARNLARRGGDVILIAGRYEGVDARVKKILRAQEISLGPYVLTGGELPAAAIVDATARHIPGVLGKISSVEEHRIASPEVYTRPEMIRYRGKNYRVPGVLRSGNHAKIEAWKAAKIRKAGAGARKRRRE